MILLGKNIFMDNLPKYFKEYSNACHWSSNMKVSKISPETYMENTSNPNETKTIFDIPDHTRIRKYKNILIVKNISDTAK